jgi:putative nucleotidyltransferase with HDIG domain
MNQASKERRPRLAAASSGVVLPRAPVPRWNRAVRRVKGGWQGLLERDPFWLLLFVLLATWALVPGRHWSLGRAEVGSVASRDYVAPRDALVLDREATAEKERRAREEVLPVYDLDTAAPTRLAQQLEALFAAGRPAPDGESEDAVRERLGKAGVTLRLTSEQLAVLRNRDFALDLLDRLRGAVETVLRRGVVAGKTALLENRSRGIQLRDLANGRERRQLDLYDYLDYPDDAREVLAVELRSWSDYRVAERSQLLELLLANIGPNLHLNQSETVRRQDAAAAAVEQVYNRVRRGQVIVRQGDQVDARAAAFLGELAGGSGRGSRFLRVLGTLLLVSAVGLLLWLGVRRQLVVETRRKTVLGEALLLLLAAVLGGKLCYVLGSSLASAMDGAPFDQARLYFFAIPFGALALVVTLLYGRNLAMLISLGYALLGGVLVEDPTWAMVLYATACSVAAILAVDHYQLKQRSVAVRAGGVVGLVGMGTVLMLTATSGGDIDGGALVLALFCALAGGMLTAAVASFFIPVCESLFAVTTGIKLVELANTNLPLLRRLAFEAPGTFQHSLMVANLAKSGCEAIGADSVLAYTAALYHDIGKVFRPEYFVENQRPGQNRHDKLLPSMSALILINHVKDGLELAREQHLPEPIQDAIAEHHGTRLITYFYNKAKEMHDPQAGEVAAEKFRYPGPRPQNKVMGVLMLADGVEAACRSLEDPSPVRLRTVIKAITDDCLRDGQLDETDLTLGDLNRIAEAFQRVLTHIHHRRLDYPGFDFNARRKERRVAGSDDDTTVSLPTGEPAAEPGDSSGAFARRA